MTCSMVSRQRRDQQAEPDEEPQAPDQPNVFYFGASTSTQRPSAPPPEPTPSTEPVTRETQTTERLVHRFPVAPTGQQNRLRMTISRSKNNRTTTVTPAPTDDTTEQTGGGQRTGTSGDQTSLVQAPKDDIHGIESVQGTRAVYGLRFDLDK